jgi:hypothetical protein
MHRDPDGEATCLWCGEVRYPTPATTLAAAAARRLALDPWRRRTG